MVDSEDVMMYLVWDVMMWLVWDVMMWLVVGM